MPSSPSPSRLRGGAIDWRLRGSAGHVLTLEPYEGEPVVLALLDAWSPAESGAVTLESLRAELRGLGAMLVALTGEALWCFRPDDEMQIFARRDELDASDVARLRAELGVERGFGLFVIDGERRVRFAHRGPAIGPAGGSDAGEETLLDALSAAGRALTAPRPVSATLRLTRRELVATSLVAGFALVLLEGCRVPPPVSSPPPPTMPPPVPVAGAAGRAGEVDVTLDVNGVARVVRIEPRVSLLDALRERMGMTGTKKGCDHGQCGACTVLVDGRRVNACLTFAIMLQGTKITTIEGLALGAELHPMQAAFVAEDALQCGYCTPGQIMSAIGLLAEGTAQTDDAVREGMSGNLCRCGAYPNIVSAIRRARGAPPGPT